LKAFVFVEGPSDKLGLEALWEPWRQRLRTKRAGIEVIPLVNKAQFLRKFGERAAEKLVGSDRDVVVGLPDLYPTDPFTKNSKTRHLNANDLKSVQAEAVRVALKETHHVQDERADVLLTRCFPSVLKHDFEMLLLAAKDALRQVIGTTDSLRGWRIPVEDQNDQRPPKRIVEDLFLAKRRRAYRDTKGSSNNNFYFF